jgi:glycosyltransferase involved in cell wall biosynthesis
MISLCVCTHNPRQDVFTRCLDSLAAQDIPADGLELVIVDNRSNVPLDAEMLGLTKFPFPARVVREERLGLTQARLRALAETRGDILIFADDDNLLDPSYARAAREFFADNPRAGAASGRSIPEFEEPPPAWCDYELQVSLALRDLGDESRILTGVVAPLGAGLTIRRTAFEQAKQAPFILGDRRGTELSSGGDSEVCHRLRIFGWELWYASPLKLTHVIGKSRLSVAYYDRLYRSFGRDWPFLEFYWMPHRFWRRLTCLRRSIAYRRSARGIGTETEPATPAAARERFQRLHDLGMSETLLRLSYGPPIWSVIRRLERLAAASR